MKRGTMQIGRRRLAIVQGWRNSYARRVFFYLTALVSAIVIVAAGASYLVMRNQIGDMAEKRTLQELHATGASFSTMFTSSIIPAAQQVFETPEVNNLIYGSAITVQQLLTATQFLDRFKLANPLIDSIAVYNSQLGIIYSTSNGLVRADDPGNAVLMRIFRQIRDFRLYRFIPRIEDGRNLLTVILGTRPYSGQRLLGGLVVNVSEAAVRSQLLGRFDAGGPRITILDSAGTLLSDNNPKLFGTDAENDSVLRRVTHTSGESGSFTVSNGRETSLISFYREPLAGWTFVSSTPSSYLFAGIARWRNEIIALFSVLFVLSVALAVTASRRVSAPLDRLLVQARALQSDFRELNHAGAHQDDIALVSETIELLTQRLHELELSQGSTEVSLARLFGRFLLDQTTSTQETARLRKRLFDASSGEVWIIVAVVDGPELRRGETRSRLLLSCRVLGRRLSGLPSVLSSVQTEKWSVAAALPRAEGASFALSDEVRAAVAEVSTAGECSFTLGVSDPVSSPDELSAAYDAASEAVRYRFREGDGKVITRPHGTVSEEPYSLPEEELRRLTEQARLLNDATVEATIRDLLTGVLSHRYEDFVFLSQSILHVLERVFVDSGVMGGRELVEFRGFVFNARWMETIDDVAAVALEWYRRFVESARQGKLERLSSFVADVKKVIEQTLYDPDLSAKGIAARLRLSVNYVRTTFRTATGDSISGYVTRLRIDRCKELLGSSDLPVKEIAHRAGFRNYNYFFTLFKKQTGRTPQEYQRQIITM